MMRTPPHVSTHFTPARPGEVVVVEIEQASAADPSVVFMLARVALVNRAGLVLAVFAAPLPTPLWIDGHHSRVWMIPAAGTYNAHRLLSTGRRWRKPSEMVSALRGW